VVEIGAVGHASTQRLGELQGRCETVREKCNRIKAISQIECKFHLRFGKTSKVRRIQLRAILHGVDGFIHGSSTVHTSFT
jgi:hypothetical protein